jgi:hypothetical protein
MKHIVKVEIWRHYPDKPSRLLGTASERLNKSIVINGKFLKDSIATGDFITLDGKKELKPSDGQEFLQALVQCFSGSYICAVPVYAGEGKDYPIKHGKFMK